MGHDINGRVEARREVCERGQAVYDEKIRARVEPDNAGKFLVLDIETGEYEMDADEVVAFDRAIARRPEDTRYLVRIGAPNAHRIGRRLKVARP